MLWVGKVIAEIRQTGSYTLAKEQYTVTPKEELECLNVVSGIYKNIIFEKGGIKHERINSIRI